MSDVETKRELQRQRQRHLRRPLSAARPLRLLAAAWLVLAGPVIVGAPGSVPGVTYFQGMCDASALIPIGKNHQIAADDEDNILRVYDREAGGMPVWSIDLSRFLRVDPAEPEVDLEAAARVGDRIYWISSHGRNRKGLLRPSRHRFFATEIKSGPGFPTVAPVGVPSARLLSDLLADPRLKVFGLARAAALPPKAPGALNIEGLTALPDGRLLIGFRNPQPQGKALLVPLENPAAVVAGERARFGDPILLDLDRRGIRGLGTEGERIIIAAGASDDAPGTRFFEWRPGLMEVHAMEEESPSGLNPESVESYEVAGSTAWLVASDDGSTRIRGRDCKKLKDIAQKRFRAVTLPP